MPNTQPAQWSPLPCPPWLDDAFRARVEAHNLSCLQANSEDAQLHDRAAELTQAAEGDADLDQLLSEREEIRRTAADSYRKQARLAADREQLLSDLHDAEDRHRAAMRQEYTERREALRKMLVETSGNDYALNDVSRKDPRIQELVAKAMGAPSAFAVGLSHDELARLAKCEKWIMREVEISLA